MTRFRWTALALFGLALAIVPPAQTQERAATKTVDVPFIFWGGDVATFHANGGLETTADSLFGKQGLKCRLTPGDDFGKQVDNYLANKTPFLRGTLSMLGQTSDKLTAKAETTPVVFLQLTWSAGDHLVGRGELKTLDQLKGKKIALQKGGPHVGMLNDILLTAKLDWKDINVVWTDDVSGDKGPAALFRKDKTVDACFAISPEMFELTSVPASGGIESTGDGTKKSVKGAHVVISTAHMSRSIADVYACRKDFYDANHDWIDKFVAGYLKACEELVESKKKAADDKTAEANYKKDLKLAMTIWGKDPALKDQVAKEDDVDGLISDANFVGLPGNEKFFKGKGNLSGFTFKEKQALRLPADPSKEALKTDPKSFIAANLDYTKLRTLGGLRGVAPDAERFGDVPTGSGKDDEILYRFEIGFASDQSTFPEKEYGKDFQRALELASLYGNMIVSIRGHADGSKFAHELLESGMKAGLITPKGAGYVIAASGKAFDPTKIDEVIAFSKDHPGLEFTQNEKTFKVSLFIDSLDKLSKARADEVKKSVGNYAAAHDLVLDTTQFKTDAVGGKQPKKLILAGQGNPENRRVEFLIRKVPLEKLKVEEFNFVK